MGRINSEERRCMVMGQEEMCEKAMKPGITAIISTSQSHPKLFALSLLSLICNSEQVEEGLEHIIVCINGPDERTGSTENQDIKQRFLEDLRSLDFFIKDKSTGKILKKVPMPLTINRVWSRVGHGECLDSAISWVHTKNYLLMHDDVFVLKPAWEKQVNKSLDESNTAFIVQRPFSCSS